MHIKSLRDPHQTLWVKKAISVFFSSFFNSYVDLFEKIKNMEKIWKIILFFHSFTLIWSEWIEILGLDGLLPLITSHSNMD